MLDQNDARRIATKLDAKIRAGRRHEIVIVRYNNQHVAQFGISRGSRSKPHSHIPRQLYISSRAAEEMSDCSMTAEEYFALLIEKGLLKNR
jgi:hypothetical protein